MPRRTKEEAEQTRQLLLRTALRMFAEQGIARTSLKEIASEAGMTHGALYWHFKNRSDLVAALYEECRFPLEDIYLDQLQSARQDALQSLGGFLGDWCKRILNDERAGHIWQVFHQGNQHQPELQALEPVIREEREEWLQRLAKIIKKARKQKQIPGSPGKTDPVPASALAIVYGVSACALKSPAAVSEKAQIKSLVHSYLYGLAA
ncbi:TetR family transcriptional regulator [Neptuniibacter halophilus]|uniref:TetR family transcriptional regulator n=1 Tax=Neptuniibacter halophilus TaxID=651666 RepID=UPI002573EF52|nr:TetR family transcriptional regulator [Neptuniibacter halophilus]